MKTQIKIRPTFTENGEIIARRDGQREEPLGMVSGMATKKYTVTLPEELAEEIRSEVGPGAFSAYVTAAIERQRERDRLGELVDWLEEEYGPVTEEERAAAEAELCENERWFAERDAALRGRSSAAASRPSDAA